MNIKWHEWICFPFLTGEICNHCKA